MSEGEIEIENIISEVFALLDDLLADKGAEFQSVVYVELAEVLKFCSFVANEKVICYGSSSSLR